MKTTVKDDPLGGVTKSRLFHRDGRVEELPSRLAYTLWLTGRGTALRVAGDNRPVYPWEYSVR